MAERNEAWERVLAAVEADAQRAAALLRAPTTATVPTDDEPGHDDAAVPADWLLPAMSVETVLPPLAEMPPVPAELRERIETLRAQIDDLRVQLAEALRDWQQPRRMVLTGSPPAKEPVYVDRRV